VTACGILREIAMQKSLRCFAVTISQNNSSQTTARNKIGKHNAGHFFAAVCGH
jgi:hypothetical protein